MNFTTGHSTKRGFTLVALLVIIAVLALLAAIPFLQLASYSHLTGVRKPIDNDTLFFWVGVCEGLVVIAVIFYSAYRRRKSS